MALKPPAKKVRMKEQEPQERIHNFFEVALGYSEREAMEEAKRCLQCVHHPCVSGCPVGIDIPGFIKKIKENRFYEAVKILKYYNNLPAVCGRVCPQETQCEAKCVVGKIPGSEPVAIGRLERFVADWEAVNVKDNQIELPENKNKKVAVIGSGPAGLTAAADLAKQGYVVDVFEALHKPGGVLVYGIPEFRLPKSIVDREIAYIKSLSVRILVNTPVGRAVTVKELLQNYDAIFIGVGAGTPKFMNIPGTNLNGVYSANEFLTRVNLMKAYLFPEFDTPIRKGKKVVVVGGGNVAMDAARSALRLGAQEVTVIYRRTEQEMPARKEEYFHAVEEGVHFRWLTQPIEYLGDEKGTLIGVRCITMELGEPDKTGRRKPIPIEDSDFVIEADTVVEAIGTDANRFLLNQFKGLSINKWGYIVADEQTGATTLKKVFAGGDIVTGAATVIEAMGAGKKAAYWIGKYLEGEFNPWK
ncbi:MAG: glutamate synthase small chain [Pseudothermotoga sp.]|jgi:glutamate synthase (NADPH/NADH) small chain|uniref:NADPH-dependent glutamate synthase n=1 Tax=Pseudothermotoga sp. TaxID=2033661 RepID=UPI0024AC4135|nr:NADPH-dependent glutamate synthase [Pseudothermotoga sp.]MDI3494232.1 glutamate synthase small chain [Pseudothermotoga sp.]MDK2883994.1 glutamate synthase small chain [Pseudothermotoga sp.]